VLGILGLDGAGLEIGHIGLLGVDGVVARLMLLRMDGLGLDVGHGGGWSRYCAGVLVYGLESVQRVYEEGE
jgi:hypothetical protein